jgi:hypothetical protein
MTKTIQKSNSFGIQFWNALPRVVGNGVRFECCSLPHHRLEQAFYRLNLDRALVHVTLSNIPKARKEPQQPLLF